MINHKWMRGFILKIVYPILMIIGSFFKHKKEGFQSFIINFNNSLVKKEKFNPKKILLLLPHCLQMDECDIRLTHNIYNCKRCGRCEIKDLIQIAEENNLTLSVATGGSLARRIVNNTKPDAIVAVACENDLSSGIADIYPLPVLGIPNIRPFGPCINTMVDLSKVRDYIEIFAKKNEN